MNLEYSNAFSEMNVSKLIEDFLGSRSPSSQLENFMNGNLTIISKTLYRGV